MPQRIVIFPDGYQTTLTAQGILSWSFNGPTLNMNLSGSGSSNKYSYTFGNVFLATMVQSALSRWYFSPASSILNVQTLLGAVNIYTISPTPTTANSPTTISLTGVGFESGAIVSFGGASYPSSFSDAQDISIAYDGAVTPGTYDVKVANPDGTTFVLPQSLQLT